VETEKDAAGVVAWRSSIFFLFFENRSSIFFVSRVPARCFSCMTDFSLRLAPPFLTIHTSTFAFSLGRFFYVILESTITVQK
jgi:hypothetical protein